MLHSSYHDLGQVTFPEYEGRQVYMYSFQADNPVMGAGCQGYEGIASELLSRVGMTEGTVYMTVDEKVVEPGMSQRRPGAHVDGCYLPTVGAWGHPVPGGGWNHYCNNLPVPRMQIIVASTVAGCRAYEGTFKGEPANDGDLEHIREQLGEGVLLPINTGFLFSPDCVHESLRFDVPTKRSFLRLAFM